MIDFMDSRNIVAIYRSDDENVRCSALAIAKPVRGKLCTIWVERQRTDLSESTAAIAVKALAPYICILLEVKTENDGGST